ncbi:CoA pyrophosphatase [Reinekea marina]|uniref:NUDIX hydrolase n=1 Tax=Reinekea marina TaxID=1310421 RepID=A0ABV7WUA8_9GAMM|nr:CoA pyrophosphatase [Reinekea marina]MDN3649275.1 CoA pyrophosphatase [Reinekea marina]
MTSDDFDQKVKKQMAGHKPTLLETEKKHAAVLLPVSLSGEPSVILTIRAAHLKSHPGDVSFPGGMVESFDGSIEAAALRETHEEINLKPDDFQVHGRLSSALSKNGVVVHPVVGTIKDASSYLASPDEIAKIFEVPWQFFAETTPELTPFNRHGIEIQVPHFYYEGHHIWGLTAMILLEFINIVEGTQWPLPPFHQSKVYSR